MKRLALIICFLAAGFLTPAAGKDYTGYVNPFVGTDAHGHTFPGAAYPFGMIQLSPDTRGAGDWDGCSGYHYSDNVIRGFSHTHLSGTGCDDWCDILVMPVTGFNAAEDDIDIKNYASPFSHQNESAAPGYYSVFLDKWGVKAELAAGRRIGMHRYTWKKDAVPQLVIDLSQRDITLDSRIEADGAKAVKGFRRSKSWASDQMVCFYMEFSQEPQEIQVMQSDKGAKALVTFRQTSRNQVTVRCGISSVSEESAKENMNADASWLSKSPFAFDALKKASSRDWNGYLSKIEVEGGEREMRNFYTALYHTAIAPCLYSDSDGRYRGMDGKIHTADGFDRYTVFSLWDTFRSLHPLFDIIERHRTVDFIRTFLSIWDECGKLPVWELSGNETGCMIGYNSAPVIADAVAKGITGFDYRRALNALVGSSNRKELGIDIYDANGLVLADLEHESVSKTLEYANDDWCIAQVAKKVGDSRTYGRYIRRAQYWRNLYDPFTGFMRPRVNGTRLSPFDPAEVNAHFTEASSWQYSFHVQQDISGLIDFSGGDSSFEEWLDELFDTSSETSGYNLKDMTGMIGQYVHGNEPSHHIAYLYPYAGVPWKTQKQVRRIMKELYAPEPDGLCGNEDCGQMSAWYIFSALGFYPVTPGSDTYVFGSPLFRNATIHLENGRDFNVRSIRYADANIYVDRVLMDGLPYSKSFMTHSAIENGSTLVFSMSDRPNPEFGSDYDDRPVSRIEEAGIVTNPWFDVPSSNFDKPVKVGIGSANDDCAIWYIVKGEGEELKPQDKFTQYKAPFTLSKSATLYAYCESPDSGRSFNTKCTLRKFNNTWKVTLTNQYSRHYTAGGPKGLVDGLRGPVNFRLGGWQGYQDCDFEAVIDLGKVQTVGTLSAGFLQDTKSWILMPQYVDFYTSTDGKVYKRAGSRVENTVDPQDYTLQTREFSADASCRARYIKVFAKNFGTLPEWHFGAGGEAFIFVDEVSIK